MMMVLCTSIRWMMSFTILKAHSPFCQLVGSAHILEKNIQHAMMMALTFDQALIFPLSLGVTGDTHVHSPIHLTDFQSYLWMLAQLFTACSVHGLEIAWQYCQLCICNSNCGIWSRRTWLTRWWWLFGQRFLIWQWHLLSTMWRQ